MSIRLKLALIIGACIAASSAACLLVFFSLQSSSLRASEREQRRLIINDVASTIRESQLAHDPMMLLDFLRDLKRHRSEIYRCRVNLGGAWQEVGGKASAPPAGGSLIEEAGQPGLRAQVWFSRVALDRRLRQSQRALLRDVSRSGAIIMFFGLFLAFALSWTLTRRIIRIEAALDQIGEGKLSSRLPVLGSDEIASLAVKVNEMAERLQELEQLKKTFVASVTHELRSPLGAIESYVKQLLENKALGAGDRENLERIQSNARRLGHFVNNLLDVAKIERGKLECVARPSDLRAIVKDTVLFFKPKAEAEGLVLEASLGTELPLVKLDPDLIGHVLTNLISNAIKFSRKGSQILVSLKRQEDSVICSVTDTGVGIRPEDLSRIFAPFERIKNPLRATGAGLGLAISKSIMEMHGGTINAVSQPGRGSRFYFTLPVGDAAPSNT